VNLKKNGKVFTSKFVRIGPSSYKKIIYRAAVSQSLRNTALADMTNLYKKYEHKCTKQILPKLAYRKSQCFINIIFHCRYLHLYFIYDGWNFNSGNYLFTTDTK